jgi:predicted MPP superfamily phosphohydrolase
MKLAWLTDIHLEFIQPQQIDPFGRTLLAHAPDALLITGDIATAPLLGDTLRRLEDIFQRPTYFVLGNHDFYGSSIDAVRAAITRLTHSSRWLHWLPQTGIVELGPDTALIGHDGWADGRFGKGVESNVMMNDYVQILDFIGLSVERRFRVLNDLGDEAAGYFDEILPEALSRYPHVIAATHVPPFKEACWYEGLHLSDDDGLPHFACEAVGKVLAQTMRRHPDHRLTVLCGHTHGQGVVDILPNLRVKTGGAEYGQPRLQELIEIA